MICVEAAEHAGYHRLNVRFNDGTEGIVDLRNTICRDQRPVFLQARDSEVFRRFWVDMDTVVWEHGLDLAPEFLYDLVRAPAAAPTATDG